MNNINSITAYNENKNINVIEYSINRPIQLGLCCLNITLKAHKPPIYPSRKIIMRIIEERGVGELKSRILANLNDLLYMVRWNQENGIKVFRLSSELFMHKTNPKVQDYSFGFAKSLLKQIGDLAKLYNQRLTFHPGQYNVVGTPHIDKFNKTIKELEYHADMLELMGMGNNSVMVVHGGGLYGDKDATKKRWCENYLKLPEKVRNRLVLENCERAFSVIDCIEISKIVGVPVVFDTHHFECYKKLHPNENFQDAGYYIKDILDSWANKGIKPKFHVSEQGSGRCGHHSDYIEEIPDYLLEIPEKYGIHIDIMIEAKKKELAIFKLYKKYQQLNCLNVKKKMIKVRKNVKMKK
jgi:UV DNA damage endonuclease